MNLDVSLSVESLVELNRRHPNITLLKGEGNAIDIARVIEASSGCYRVFGGHGGIEFPALLRSGRLEIVRHGGGAESFGEESGTGGGADPMAFTHEWHQAVIEDFAAALVEGRLPAVSGRDALASHRLIEAIARSSREGVAIDIVPGPHQEQND